MEKRKKGGKEVTLTKISSGSRLGSVEWKKRYCFKFFWFTRKSVFQTKLEFWSCLKSKMAFWTARVGWVGLPDLSKYSPSKNPMKGYFLWNFSTHCWISRKFSKNPFFRNEPSSLSGERPLTSSRAPVELNSPKQLLVTEEKNQSNLLQRLLFHRDQWNCCRVPIHKTSCLLWHRRLGQKSRDTLEIHFSHHRSKVPLDWVSLRRVRNSTVFWNPNSRVYHRCGAHHRSSIDNLVVYFKNLGLSRKMRLEWKQKFTDEKKKTFYCFTNTETAIVDFSVTHATFCTLTFTIFLNLKKSPEKSQPELWFSGSHQNWRKKKSVLPYKKSETTKKRKFSQDEKQTLKSFELYALSPLTN